MSTYEGRIWECPLCPKRWSSESTKADHMERDHAVPRVPCDDCDHDGCFCMERAAERAKWAGGAAE